MRQIQKGSVDRSVEVYIIDSTDGTPETGVVWNTAGIDLNYRRDGAAVVAITEATLAALTTAHTDGGFLAIGNGYYRLDPPDAGFGGRANRRARARARPPGQRQRHRRLPRHRDRRHPRRHQRYPGGHRHNARRAHSRRARGRAH